VDSIAAGEGGDLTVQNLFLECEEVRFEELLHRHAFSNFSLLDIVKIRDSIGTASGWRQGRPMHRTLNVVFVRCY